MVISYKMMYSRAYNKLYYEMRNSETEMVYSVFPNGNKVSHGSLMRGVNLKDYFENISNPTESELSLLIMLYPDIDIKKMREELEKVK